MTERELSVTGRSATAHHGLTREDPVKTSPETAPAPLAHLHPALPGAPHGAAAGAAPLPDPLPEPLPESPAEPLPDPLSEPPSGGLIWTLPPGPGCASRARAVLGEALAGAGVPRDVAGDARLMVSELATNAHQHARGHGPHELWLYAGAPGEARCAVFDRHPSSCLPVYSWTSGDFGRGLSIVRELSEGRWGLLRTLARTCSPAVPGKAVWFAIPGRVVLPGPLYGPHAG